MNPGSSTATLTHHVIQNFFAKLKQFRAIATRYDKTARNFLAGVHLVASSTVLHQNPQPYAGR